MYILIEEHQYPADAVKHILEGISTLRDVDDMVSVNYVGYYYNPIVKDCVFILPKVLIDDKEQVFGHCTPESIIHLEEAHHLTKEEHDFIYELSVWIYRAIVVYNDLNPQNNIVLRQYVSQMSKGRLRQSNTFLDILMAIQKFNRENQDFFFFILKNIHSGYNKINWTRTISHSQAYIQDNTPIYLNPVNKKRKINFDEELLIIFFSILNFMNEKYGFPVQINVNFPLIKGAMFENYRNGMGKVRLLQIKYKYFSDKALYLWELCYAFFDQSRKINVETDDKEYLLVKNFNIVFESIIDELIGEKELSHLKEQEDGKIIDHIYRYKDLTNNVDDKPIYYIGDSKYYKRGHAIGSESVYKQFTYARNIIQWNLDLFNDGTEKAQEGHLKLRDDVTEGYNIIPNFFISAQQNVLKQEDDIHLTDNEKKYFTSRQFDNRLFDRDSFIVAHYDVNFLFIVALYGRNSSSAKLAWRNKVRAMFRKEIQVMLSEHYNFYVMTAHADVNADQYMRDNFQMVLGKVFTPFKDSDYYSLALDKNPQFAEENEFVKGILGQNFNIKECPIGTDPATVLPKVVRPAAVAAPQQFLTMHWLERYLDKTILVGAYRGPEHLIWILGANDKNSLIYNIRLDKKRDGAQVRKKLLETKVVFVVLYEVDHEHENKYRVFRVHHHAELTEERMRTANYPHEPQGNYFCYVFDEEVTLGNLDIHSLVSTTRIFDHNYKNGAPIFVTGEELMKYRK